MIGKIALYLILSFGLASCASTPYSTAISQPASPVKTVFVIIEMPNNVVFNVPNGVNITSHEHAYEALFTRAVNNDMAWVFKDNGIDAKVAVIPSGRIDIRNFLLRMSAADRAKWKYLLWIRHSDGTYSDRGLLYYHLESVLVDAGTGRLLWKAHGGSDAPSVDETRWANGDVYQALLANLAKDKMIELPGESPVIKIR